MKKKTISALDNAILALQAVATELKNEERQRNTRQCKCQTTVVRTECRTPQFGGWEFPPIPVPVPVPAPLPQWGVAGQPKEDKNKIFGINVRVDEPRREDYRTRWEFERDHEKFDRLVDAAEACTWPNKSNTAPLHKVKAIRRRVEDGPVFNVNLVGETHWW